MSKEFLNRVMVPAESMKLNNPGMASGKRVNKESLTPFDYTLYKGKARVGTLPDVTHRPEEEEEAFSYHIHTSRLSPQAFILKGEGKGGRSNAHLALEAAKKKLTHSISPIVADVSHPPQGLAPWGYVPHTLCEEANYPTLPEPTLTLHHARSPFRSAATRLTRN